MEKVTNKLKRAAGKVKPTGKVMKIVTKIVVPKIVAPAISEITEQLKNIDKKLIDKNYEAESFSVTFKGIKGSLGITLNFRKKK